jgi:hypothetical protein
MASIQDEIDEIKSRHGSILDEAERRFGPRDSSFKVLDIEICSDSPHLWISQNPRGVVIKLGAAAKGNLNEALAQLAHETIHLLNPCEVADGSVLEEGLATRFQLEYGGRLIPGYSCSDDPRWPKYANACALVEELFQGVPDAITRLRSLGCGLSAVSEAQILALNPGVEERLAKLLARKFLRWSSVAA